LEYTGTGESNNRFIEIGLNSTGGTNTGGGIILANGTGALEFTRTIFNQSVNSPTAGRTLTLGGTNTGSNTIHGIIQNNTSAKEIRVEKIGAGTWVLGGANTYTGITTVSAGTLLINGDQTASTGAVGVANTATLGGSGIVGGATTINNGGILSPGNSPGTLTFDTDLTLKNGATLLFESGDLVNVNGQLDLDNSWTLQLEPGLGWAAGGSTTLFTYDSIAATPWLTPTIVNNSGIGGIFTLTDTGSSIVINGLSVIPEPSTGLLTLLGIGMAALSWRRVRGSIPSGKSPHQRH
jgi:fibronectin-binding autotransporter adhesin